MTDVEKQIRKLIETYPDKESIIEIFLLTELKLVGGGYTEQRFPIFVGEDIEVMAGGWVKLNDFINEYSNPKIIGIVAVYEITKHMEDI